MILYPAIERDIMSNDKKVKLKCLQVEIELLEGRLSKAYIDRAYLQGKMDQLRIDNDKNRLPFMHNDADERTLLSEMDAADSVIESICKDLAGKKAELSALEDSKEEVNVYGLFTDLYNKACLKTAPAEELLEEAYNAKISTSDCKIYLQS